MFLYRSLALAAAGLVLAACGGGGGAGGAALAGDARAFTRTDSAVTALPNGSGRYTASRVVTISNDDGGATTAEVSLLDVNGGITTSASSGGYQIQITLRADADTEADARAALATLTVEHRDALGSDTLYLNNEVKFGSYSGNNVSRNADVTATLPAALAYRLYQRIDNGNLGTSGLHGPLVELEGVNSMLTLSGTWDAALASSANGGITVSGDIASLQAANANGNVQSALSGTRNSDAVLDSSSGNVDATVARTATSGYDLEGQSQAGNVTIVVAGTQPVGTPSATAAHYRSANYDSSNPRIRVVGRTMSGNVSIHE